MNAAELSEKEVKDTTKRSVEPFVIAEKLFYRASCNEERRAKPRVREQFPARIWSVDSRNLPFGIDCILDNMSSTGLYLRIPLQIPPGDEVRVVVHLLNGPTTGASAYIYGEILRDEPQSDGRHGVAISIKSHEFL